MLVYQRVKQTSHVFPRTKAGWTNTTDGFVAFHPHPPVLFYVSHTPKLPYPQDHQGQVLTDAGFCSHRGNPQASLGWESFQGKSIYKWMMILGYPHLFMEPLWLNPQKIYKNQSTEAFYPQHVSPWLVVHPRHPDATKSSELTMVEFSRSNPTNHPIYPILDNNPDIIKGVSHGDEKSW